MVFGLQKGEKAVFDPQSDVADAAEASLVPQAKAIADKFYLAFQLFAKCHHFYNLASFLKDEDLEKLSKWSLYSFQVMVY